MKCSECGIELTGENISNLGFVKSCYPPIQENFCRKCAAKKFNLVYNDECAKKQEEKENDN